MKCEYVQKYKEYSICLQMYCKKVILFIEIYHTENCKLSSEIKRTCEMSRLVNALFDNNITLPEPFSCTDYKYTYFF